LLSSSLLKFCPPKGDERRAVRKKERNDGMEGVTGDVDVDVGVFASLARLHKQHRVDAPVVLGVVRDLGILTPDDLTGRRDEAEIAHVDLSGRVVQVVSSEEEEREDEEEEEEARCDHMGGGEWYLEDGSLSDDTQLRVEWRLRVLLDAQDVQVECGLQLRVSHVRFLIEPSSRSKEKRKRERERVSEWF
jgi:hypothetical protein